MTEAYTAIISLPEVAVVFFFFKNLYHCYLYLYSLLFHLCHKVNIYCNWLREQFCNLSLNCCTYFLCTKPVKIKQWLMENYMEGWVYIWHCWHAGRCLYSMCCEVDITLTNQLMDSFCIEAPGLLQESLHHHDLVITISVLCYFELLRDHTTIKR